MPPSTDRHQPPGRVAVVGAGCIGAAIAWRLAVGDADVTLYDDRPGAGATHAAGGMLAPACEASYDEEASLRLGLASLELWPEFASNLAESTGIDPGLRQEGSLLVGFDHDDDQIVCRHAALLDRHARPYERLTSRQVRSLEPALAPGVHGGLLVSDDHSVDNRALVGALLSAGATAGVTTVPTRVEVLVDGGGRLSVRPRTTTPGAGHGDDSTPYDAVVIAAGHDSAHVSAALDIPVYPSHGEILRFHAPPGLLTHTVRAGVHGDPIYLIPRRDGQIAVGATQSDIGAHHHVTARGLRTLLEAALTLLPELGEAHLVDAVARCRPATPDNAPILGGTPVPGLYVATGSHRDGILHTPVVADALTGLVLEGRTAYDLTAFALTRFDRPRRPQETTR